MEGDHSNFELATELLKWNKVKLSNRLGVVAPIARRAYRRWLRGRTIPTITRHQNGDLAAIAGIITAAIAGVVTATIAGVVAAIAGVITAAIAGVITAAAAGVTIDAEINPEGVCEWIIWPGQCRRVWPNEWRIVSWPVRCNHDGLIIAPA
jgi:hypothetical protein